jgi:hypothetical protein
VSTVISQQIIPHHVKYPHGISVSMGDVYPINGFVTAKTTAVIKVMRVRHQGLGTKIRITWLRKAESR